MLVDTLVEDVGRLCAAGIVVPLPDIPQKPPQLAFTRVEPQNLYQVWPWILKGLQEVKARVGERAVSYTPANVRNSLMLRQADLHIVTEDSNPVCFVILTIQNDPWLGVPTTLHVWIEYSEATSMRVANFAHQEIIRIGHQLCLKDIQMASPRAAWARRLQSLGMKPVITIYALDLFPEE